MDGSTVNETNYKRKKLLYDTVQQNSGTKYPQIGLFDWGGFFLFFTP